MYRTGKLEYILRVMAPLDPNGPLHGLTTAQTVQQAIEFHIRPDDPNEPYIQLIGYAGGDFTYELWQAQLELPENERLHQGDMVGYMLREGMVTTVVKHLIMN